MAGINRSLQIILLGLIRSYQLLLSPLLGQHCRFYPSCSHYAQDAVHYHGPWQGSWLAVKRVCRCHPWHEGGVDPVPGTEALYGSDKHRDSANAATGEQASEKTDKA